MLNKHWAQQPQTGMGPQTEDCMSPDRELDSLTSLRGPNRSVLCKSLWIEAMEGGAGGPTDLYRF